MARRPAARKRLFSLVDFGRFENHGKTHITSAARFLAVNKACDRRPSIVARLDAILSSRGAFFAALRLFSECNTMHSLTVSMALLASFFALSANGYLLRYPPFLIVDDSLANEAARADLYDPPSADG